MLPLYLLKVLWILIGAHFSFVRILIIVIIFFKFDLSFKSFELAWDKCLYFLLVQSIVFLYRSSSVNVLLNVLDTLQIAVHCWLSILRLHFFGANYRCYSSYQLALKLFIENIILYDALPMSEILLVIWVCFRYHKSQAFYNILLVTVINTN